MISEHPAPRQGFTLWFMKLMLRALGSLPIWLRSIVGKFLGTIIGCVPFREQKIARLQIARFLAPPRPEALTRAVFGSVAQTLFESLNLKPLLKSLDRHVTCAELPYVHELVAQRKPIVALTAHTGNWDLLAAYMVAQGVQLSTIGREARSPLLQRLLEDIRLGYGVKTLWRTSSGSRDVLRELSAGRTVAALIDQDTAVTSEFSLFFGEPAKSPSALIALAKKKGCTLVTAFITRTGFCKYAVQVAPLTLEGSIREILDEYHQRLEKCIRAHPEQWVWFHKRWRSTPDGLTMRTADYIQFLAGRNQRSQS